LLLPGCGGGHFSIYGSLDPQLLGAHDRLTTNAGWQALGGTAVPRQPLARLAVSNRLLEL